MFLRSRTSDNRSVCKLPYLLAGCALKKNAFFYGRYGSRTNTLCRRDDQPRSRVIVATHVCTRERRAPDQGEDVVQATGARSIVPKYIYFYRLTLESLSVLRYITRPLPFLLRAFHHVNTVQYDRDTRGEIKTQSTPLKKAPRRGKQRGRAFRPRKNKSQPPMGVVTIIRGKLLTRNNYKTEKSTWTHCTLLQVLFLNRRGLKHHEYSTGPSYLKPSLGCQSCFSCFFFVYQTIIGYSIFVPKCLRAVVL